ncbi:MAG TPA: sialate O-acetylesterase [Acidobacteriaceae bacterium]|nr:sialate O-acetylesterase [Acidobacteriaceae bacterium]
MKLGFFTLVICLVSTPLHAELRLASVLTDHAVLQRDAPIHLWGEASPAEKIAVSFHGQSTATTANSLGLWEVWLKPEPAGGPYTLTVHGSTELTRSDLLVGDVWFASGQSNMEMPLSGFPPSAHVTNADQEIAQADLAQVRLLRVEHQSSDSPLAGVSGVWQPCTPATAKDFSAVAYFFAREINRREHIPVGVIDSSWGGTPIDSWISLDALSADASLMPAFAARAHFADQQTHLGLVEAAEKNAVAEAAAQHLPPPQHPWHPDPTSWIPAGLYNGMVAPFTPYAIKGFLWYQGETDSASDRAGLYAKLLPTLIADWRRQWGQGNLPFLFVQISSFDSPAENWGLIRDSQRRTLHVANTGMAVTLDIGQRDNVHPPDKQTVGARLALAGRALAYGEAGLEFSGPVYRQTTREGGAVEIWFDHAEGLHSSGNEVKGFEVAGADGHFVAATAKVQGSSVVVSSPEVTEPVQVRYAWQSFTDANLYNDVPLPASTFVAQVP